MGLWGAGCEYMVGVRGNGVVGAKWRSGEGCDEGFREGLHFSHLKMHLYLIYLIFTCHDSVMATGHSNFITAISCSKQGLSR